MRFKFLKINSIHPKLLFRMYLKEIFLLSGLSLEVQIFKFSNSYVATTIQLWGRPFYFDIGKLRL